MPSRTAIRYGRTDERPARVAALLLQPWLWATQAVSVWSTMGAWLFTAGLRRPRA
jgi:hypothetical protein